MRGSGDRRWRWFPSGHRAIMLEQNRAIREGEAFKGEWENYRKDGSRVWIDARVTRFADASGRPVGIMGVAHEGPHPAEACRGGPARIRGTLAGPLPTRGRSPGGGTPSPGPGITRRDRPQPHRDRDHIAGRHEVGRARPAPPRRNAPPSWTSPSRQVRRLSLDLRPSLLDDLGLGGGPAFASRSPGPAGRLLGPLRRRPGRHPPRTGPGDRNRRLADRTGGVDRRRTASPRPPGEARSGAATAPCRWSSATTGSGSTWRRRSGAMRGARGSA